MCIILDVVAYSACCYRPAARDEAPALKRAWTKLAAGGLGMESLQL
jgi:hypothetical protein